MHGHNTDPIQSVHLIRNGKHSNQTVPIELPRGSPLEVSCTAIGEWTPPAVNISARIGDQVIVNSSSDPTNKTTTAKLKLDWRTINGKNVTVFCEAIDNQYGRTNITSSEVKVTSTFCSLSAYIYIYVVCCMGDFTKKPVHTFVMYTHFIRCCIVDNWLFPIHTSTNHCSTKDALSKLIATD